MNWIGLARSLQTEIIATIGALLLVLAVWLIVRVVLRRSALGAAQARFRVWTDCAGSIIALVIIGGMLWHLVTVTAANRLPRQDVDRSPVYERMDAITKK